MSAAEDHSRHENHELVARLRERGIETPEDLLYALETAARSDVWVFVASEQDGTLVNATGFFPDAHAAFLAGEQYRRDWNADSPDDPDGTPVCTPIPLFIRKENDG